MKLRDGRYLLQDELGGGTTASVFRARDTLQNVDRAIKVLSPAFARHADTRTRFEREAETLSRLKHPNIVEVYDFGFDEGRFFIVMELLEGGTLMEAVERGGPLPVRTALNVTVQMLHALHYAHTQGVIHRDIKPQNVLLTASGVPKLVDFGLARTMYFDRTLTVPGVVMGTWGYMAPEQRVDTGRVDIRTDIYAAGGTMYTALTGRDAMDLIKEAMPAEVRAPLPDQVAEIVLKATRFLPDERYQNAAEMAKALAFALEDMPSEGLEGEQTILVPRASAPIPVKFQNFDDLAQRKSELTGPRGAVRRRTVAREPDASSGAAAARPDAARTATPRRMSWAWIAAAAVAVAFFSFVLTLVGLLLLRSQT